MKTTLISFFTFLLPGILSAQVYISITGRVTDSETNEALSGCSVYLMSLQCGTVTDSSGHFKLSIPAERMDEYLVCSYIGYKSFHARVSQIVYQDNNINLKRDIRILDEINIYPNSPDIYSFNAASDLMEELNETANRIETTRGVYVLSEENYVNHRSKSEK